VVCRRLLCGLATAAHRRLVPPTVYQSLVVALVLSRLDYGNATPAGLPTCLLNLLQSALNATVRSIAGLRCLEHITDALASFHWLRAPERIKFKLAVIVYRTLHGAAPQYLSDQLQYVADLPTRRRGRASAHRLPIFSTSGRRDVLLSAIGRLLLPALDFGTVYLLTSGLPRHLQHFVGS